jgi:hypothetical protein
MFDIYEDNKLITTAEVFKFGNLKTFADSYLLQRALFDVEDSIFSQILGKEFFEKLCIHKIEYIYTQYDDLYIYNASEVVNFNGVLYECKQTTVAGTAPNMKNIRAGIWGEALKFDKEEYNKFWRLYLGRFLALSVQLNISMPATYNLSNTGLTRSIGQNQLSTDVQEIKAYKADLENKIRDVKIRMHDYILNNQHDDLYTLYKGITTNEQKVKRRKSSRRWAFNRLDH